MKLKSLMLASTGSALAAVARRDRTGPMADSMTLVSWGGAYQASQHQCLLRALQAERRRRR
jgi:putative spermidine/putrescine transport system substrate-binding protein